MTRKRLDAKIAAEASRPIPGDPEAAMEPVAAAIPDSLHPLDAAPVNAKIVVVIEGNIVLAVLGSPDGVSYLDPDDPANRLPVGARIRKTADGYVADQIGLDLPAVTFPTATAAIAGFVPHFHLGR